MTQHGFASHCIFCKIAQRMIPAAVVLETREIIAFLDINPVNKGHVLLVPKEHHADLLELPEELAAETARLLPSLARAVKFATGADGLNVIINNGVAAGQTVPHGHWHLIPRFQDDPVNWPWPHSEYLGDEIGQMQFRIERELRPAGDD